MDNSTTGDVTYTAGMVTDLFQDAVSSSKGTEFSKTAGTTTTSSLAGLQPDTQESSKAGLAAGVTILVIALIAAGVAGFIFFIKRRKSKRTSPVVDNTKNGTERRSESRSTWHEIDLNSSRSSDVSTVVDYDVNMETELEMQPSSLFPVFSVSMYDDEDSTDEKFPPHTPSVGGSVSVTITQSEESDINKALTPSRNKNSSLKGSKQSEEKTTMVFDKTTKSFKVEESITEETDPNKFQNDSNAKNVLEKKSEKDRSSSNAENALEKKSEKDRSSSEDSKPSKTVQSGYELAKIVPGEAMHINESQVGIELSSSGNVNDKETGNSENGSDYKSAQPESDELYVNHAALDRNTTSETNITTEENSEIIVDNVPMASEEPAVLNETEKQSVERKPAKAPIPQPRLSKRESSNTVGMPHSDSSRSELMSEKDNQESMSGTAENCVEHSPATFDSVESDYDTVDDIYDIPKNNKEIDERDDV